MTRVLLPARRQIETCEIEAAGQTFTVSVGRGQAVGEPANGAAVEVFIKPAKGKAGSLMDAMLAEAGFIASQALRHGAALGRLRGGMQRNDAGEPETPIGAALDAMRGE